MHLSLPNLCRLTRSLALISALLCIDCVAAPVSGYKVVSKYPHSTSSYTEGFFYLDDLFYEGTGLQGHSAVLVIQPETGLPVQQHDLPPQYFGEGIINWGPDIYEWTWKSHICFVYDRFTFRLVKQFSYAGEGWGMTRTAKQIITSTARRPSASAILRPLKKFATLLSKMERRPSANSTNSNTSRARSMPTSGTRTA